MWICEKCGRKGDVIIVDDAICPDCEEMGLTHDVERAVEKLVEMMKGRFSSLYNVQLEHVDAAGYWFTFEVPQDDRRQKWCIYHTDLVEKA